MPSPNDMPGGFVTGTTLGPRRRCRLGREMGRRVHRWRHDGRDEPLMHPGGVVGTFGAAHGDAGRTGSARTDKLRARRRLCGCHWRFRRPGRITSTRRGRAHPFPLQRTHAGCVCFLVCHSESAPYRECTGTPGVSGGFSRAPETPFLRLGAKTPGRSVVTRRIWVGQ